MTRPPNSTWGQGKPSRRPPRVIAALSKEREQHRQQQIRDELAQLKADFLRRQQERAA